MSASTIAIVVIFVAIGFIAYQLKKRGSTLWSGLFGSLAAKRRYTVEELNAMTAREREKAAELQDVLEAKRRYAKAKDDSVRLRQEIEDIDNPAKEPGRSAVKKMRG